MNNVSKRALSFSCVEWIMKNNIIQNHHLLHNAIRVSYKSKIIEAFIRSFITDVRSIDPGWRGGERVKTQTDLKKVSISFFVPTNTSLMKEWMMNEEMCLQRYIDVTRIRTQLPPSLAFIAFKNITVSCCVNNVIRRVEYFSNAWK